jgi:hypothetical protein
MPRQPYPRSYLKPIYGLAHPEYMTKMAEGVGRCIMLFSYVDWQMALVLAAVMKADCKSSRSWNMRSKAQYSSLAL